MFMELIFFRVPIFRLGRVFGFLVNGVFSYNFPKAVKYIFAKKRGTRRKLDAPLTPSPNIGEIVPLEGVPCAHRHVHGDNCSLSRVWWRRHAVYVLVLHKQGVLFTVSKFRWYRPGEKFCNRSFEPITFDIVSYVLFISTGPRNLWLFFKIKLDKINLCLMCVLFCSLLPSLVAGKARRWYNNLKV